MATWEDGPEYAPVERPAAFAEPATGIGLETPPPQPPEPTLPASQPVFADPAQPGPPLASLVPVPPDERDPRQPFDVVSSVMTADSSAWASAHWASPQPGSAPQPAPQVPIAISPTRGGAPTPYASTPATPTPTPYAPTPYAPTPNSTTSGATAWPNGAGAPTQNGHRSPGAPSAPGAPGAPAPNPPAAQPPLQNLPPTGHPGYPPPSGSAAFPPPSHPSPSYPAPNYPPPSYPPPGPGQFPAPGTTQWFGPGSYQQPPAPPVPDARTVLAAATPGMLVTLVVGGFIWILAPITLILALLLSRRMTYARKATQTAYAAVLAFLGVVGLVSIFTTDGLFSDWWANVAGWGCFGSWVMLVLAPVLVYRAQKLHRPDPPPTSPTPRSSLR